MGIKWDFIYRDVNFKSNWLVAVLIFLVVSGVYFGSAPNTVSGIADSDELITRAVDGALAHPPGYPIFLTLVGWTIKLLPSWSYFKAANLVANISQAGAISIMYLVAVEMLDGLGPQLKKSRRQLVAIAASLIVAFAYDFWLYGSVLEVYSFSNLLAATAIYLTLRYRGGEKRSGLILIVICLVLALMFWHHQLLLIMWPFIILEILRKNKRGEKIKFCLVLLTIWLIVGLGYTSLILGSYELQLGESWAFEPTISGLWSYFSRADYSGMSIEAGETVKAVWGKIDLRSSWLSLVNFTLVVMPKSFGVSYGLAVIGLLASLWLWQRFKWYGAMMLVGFGVIIGYFTVPYPTKSMGSILTLALTERLYLLIYLWLVPIIALGIARLAANFDHKKYSLGLWLVLGWGSAAIVWWRNSELMNFTTETTWSDYWMTTLDQVESTAQILCFDDLSCFSLEALLLGGNQKDILVLPVIPQLLINRIAEYPERCRTGYRDNPFMVMDLIGNSLRRDQPVYVTAVSPTYVGLISNGGNRWNLSPIIGVEKVECNPKLSLDNLKAGQVLKVKLSAKYTFGQLINANIYQQALKGLRTQAVSECWTAFEHWQQANKEAKARNIQAELNHSWWAVIKESTNLQFRLNLASVLEKANLLPLAKREYRLVYYQDQRNIEAVAGLKRLAGVESLD